MRINFSVKLTTIFSLRVAPIGDIIHNNKLSFHCADDSPCHFDLIVASLTAAVHHVEQCIDINDWITFNM